MKNIHILPTDKPSRLYINMQGILSKDELKMRLKNVNIYITSDEEIKEGDWCLDKFNQRWKLEDKKLIAFDSRGIKRFSTDNILGHECKKIILTTDQDLIEDGVQSIPDEFLEWFVKNPSCEEVEVESNYRVKSGTIQEHNEGKAGYEYYEYKIIIPKEEPKQIKCYCGHTTYCDCGPLEEPKQETLEEFAERIYTTELVMDVDISEDLQLAFINGAKWQQENSYSEYDMVKFVSFVGKNYIKAKGFYYMKGDFEKSIKVSIHQIFEQFNK